MSGLHLLISNEYNERVALVLNFNFNSLTWLSYLNNTKKIINLFYKITKKITNKKSWTFIILYS